MNKTANLHGRSFEHSKETFELCDLVPGDHIVGKSLFGLGLTFWHHMIVNDIDLDRKEINVIHYYHDLDPPWKLPSVCRTTISFTPDSFYRIVYEDDECFPASEVLKKANDRLGEKRYWPFTNNCEHFANECKTGEKKCRQIWNSFELLARSAVTSISSFLSRANQWFKMVFRSENGWFRQPGISEIAEYGAKFSTGLSIFIAFVVEVVVLSYDCRDAKKKFESGSLSREEYYEVVVKRVCEAVCSIPGFAIGFVLGGMVMPVLGAFLGGAVGTYLGKEFGGYLGDMLAQFFTEHLACNEKIA